MGLRDFMERLEEAGEIQRIQEEVDWNLEIGAAIRYSYDVRAGAPLFEKIKGYTPEFRVLGASFGLSRPGRDYARLALAMGEDPSTPIQRLIDIYRERLKEPIPPVLINSGPCKENKLIGDEVDLLKFPAPLLHEGDGGRYLGTWHIVVTKDPQSGKPNWGTYRMMVHDEKTMGGIISPNQHIGMHFCKYEHLGMPMPFAVAIGVDPMVSLVAGGKFPPSYDEPSLAGGLCGRPVELVKCETVDLEVPADAEIVIEGVVLPRERKDEGPFGEYTGYRAADRLPRPVYHVSAITYRNAPILTVCCPGVPVDDNGVISTVGKSANLLASLKDRFPVSAVFTPPEGVNHMAIVATKVPYQGYVKELALALWGSPAGRGVYYVVVVEDDIDIFDLKQVLWAFTTRCHPADNIFTIAKGPGSQLLPFLNPKDRLNAVGAYALFDCTWPKDWPLESIPEKASLEQMWPRNVQERVKKLFSPLPPAK